MMKKSASFHSIPHDLLVETILIRLPVKSLIRFKSVCKLWLSSIQDPYFIDLHYAYSLQHRRRFLLTFPCDKRVWSNYKYHAVSVDPEGETADLFDFFLFKIVARYRGLILYISHLGHCVVCNPSTKETIILPDLRKEDLQEGTRSKFHLGYDRRSKVHKVLHVKLMIPNVPYSDDYYCARCDVITLGGGGGVWREIDQLPPYHLDNRYVAYVNGVIHWKNRGEDPFIPPDEQVLVAFDFTDEKFKVIPLPEYIFASTEDNMRHSRLLQVVEEGQIALGDTWNSTNINTITFWILDDYAKQTWIQKRFDKPLDMQQDMCRFMGVLANGQVIMRLVRIKPIFCLYYHDLDLVKQVSRKVEFTWLPSQAFCPTFQFGSGVTVTQFVESLHSCNGKINKYPKGMNFTDDGWGVLFPFMADKIRRLC